MLWIQDTLAPQLNKLCTLCISTKHSNCEITAEPSLICCSPCLPGLLRLVINQGNQRKRWAETGTQGDWNSGGKAPAPWGRRGLLRSPGEAARPPILMHGREERQLHAGGEQARPLPTRHPRGLVLSTAFTTLSLHTLLPARGSHLHFQCQPSLPPRKVRPAEEKDTQCCREACLL